MGLPAADDELRRLAATYVWWMQPEQALARPVTFLCQVMRLATWEDARRVLDLYGADAMRDALAHAPAGVLDARSWTYWHRVLGVTPIPALPVRPLPAEPAS